MMHKIQRKTPRQIRRYLQQQEWYPSFRRMVMTETRHPLVTRIKLLLGYHREKTLRCAIDWKQTVQGHAFWSGVNSAFLLWYHAK